MISSCMVCLRYNLGVTRQYFIDQIPRTHPHLDLKKLLSNHRKNREKETHNKMYYGNSFAVLVVGLGFAQALPVRP